MASDEHGNRSTVGVASVFAWILAGAVVCGGFGWVLASVVDASTAVGGAAGLAAGGGAGAAVRLLVFPAARSEPETVTVEMEQDAERVEPLDLFEAHPDPLCYFAGEETPTVRAVNPAYETTFGVSASAIEGAGLDGALMTAEPGDIVDAAADSRAIEATVSCETVEGERRYLVRVVPVASASQSRGYVLYTPRENEQ